MADEQRGSQARPFRGRDGVDGVEAEVDLVEHLRHEERQIAQMFARGHLRHDAAVGTVEFDLRTDDLREDVGRPGIGFDQGHSGLVTGGLDA